MPFGNFTIDLVLVRDPPQGEMYNKVKVDDSFWTLEDGKEVSIALQKVSAR